MSASAQDAFPLRLTTPLGGAKLLLRSFHGEERLSGLFHYALEMSSADKRINFSSIVGKDITIEMSLATGDNAYLNGIAARFTQAGTDARGTTYYAEVRPKLWLLTLCSNCRIFQAKSVPEILQQLLREHGITDFKNRLTGNYAKREYCVQYMESDFDFLSRLMEDEGIFFFFEHAKGKHVLILADDPSAHHSVTGYPTICLRPAGAEWVEEGAIEGCTVEEQAVTGRYRAADYNFEIPSTNLLSTSGEEAARTIYEYPAGRLTRDAMDKKASIVIGAIEAPKRLLRGTGFCRSFRAGAAFNLTGHPRTDLNTDYVIRQVSFHGDQTSAFTNTFETQPLATPFRAPRTTVKPRIPGTQTAIVAGKSGEEIWTDKYGRVRLHFHWDQEGKRNEKDSCWVRVAQGWAGKQWGSMFLPRIGQEVVVSFLDGDPDRPLVTGCVYNGDQTVPYALPGDQTRSTIKSRSSKGGGGFNELRFEDKKDSEEIYLHAQKDHKVDVLNDQVVTVKNNRTVTVQEKDEKLVVEKGNRTVQVKTGNETHEVKGKRDVTVTGKETHTSKADYEIHVSGNFTLKVDGNIKIEAGGSVAIQSGTTFDNNAGTALTNKAGTDLKNEASQSLTNKAGTTLENNAGVSLTNKGSLSQTIDGGGSLTIKGGKVQVN